MALEIMSQNSEYKNTDVDHSKALAYRRAASVLKSLPYKITSMQQLKNKPDIGKHVNKVIEVSYYYLISSMMM